MNIVIEINDIESTADLKAHLIDLFERLIKIQITKEVDESYELQSEDEDTLADSNCYGERHVTIKLEHSDNDE